VEACFAAAGQHRQISRIRCCVPCAAEVLLCRFPPGRPWRQGGGMRWCGCFVVLPLSTGRGGEGERKVAVRSSMSLGCGPLLWMAAALSPPLLWPQWWWPVGVGGGTSSICLRAARELLSDGYSGQLRRPDRTQGCRAPLPLLLSPCSLHCRRWCGGSGRRPRRNLEIELLDWAAFCTRSRVLSALLPG
jgi:hypothetical protein